MLIAHTHRTLEAIVYFYLYGFKKKANRNQSYIYLYGQKSSNFCPYHEIAPQIFKTFKAKKGKILCKIDHICVKRMKLCDFDAENVANRLNYICKVSGFDKKGLNH